MLEAIAIRFECIDQECGWWVGLLFAVNPEHFVVRVLLPHGFSV